MKKVLFILIVVGMVEATRSQTLVGSSEMVCHVGGASVELYKAYPVKDQGPLYYLPTRLRAATNARGQVEFSFQDYGEGAVMHLLLTWGLRERHRSRLQEQLIDQSRKRVMVAGAVLPDSSPKGIQITGRTDLAQLLNKGLTQKGKVPLTENGKMALSFKFDKEEAAKVKRALNNRTQQHGTYISLFFSVNFKERSGEPPKAKRTELKENLLTILNP